MSSFTVSSILLLVSCLFLVSVDAQYRQARRQRVRTYQPQPQPQPQPAVANYVAEETYPPQPHNFNYDVTDEYGNRRFHQESGDGSGRVTGSYGYANADGIYRTVDYVADENGYRATVRSNEPGMDNPPPADTQYALEPAPANAYDVPARRSYQV